MQALTLQHDTATKALLARFQEEVEGIKEAHRREVDRLMREMRGETEESEREAEDMRGKYVEEVRGREAAHKELEHDLRVEEEKRISEETLRQQKKALKADFLTVRDSRLKAAISDLSAKKLAASKALESDFQPSIVQAKLELRQLTAELQARPPPVLPLPTAPQPTLQDSSVNTEEAVEVGDVEAERAFGDVAVLLNAQCEELEGRVNEVVIEVQGRLEGLEMRYRAIVAECRMYEEAIADLEATI